MLRCQTRKAPRGEGVDLLHQSARVGGVDEQRLAGTLHGAGVGFDDG
jgi:hypothetical protein